jgi:hypothetical protein
VRDAGEVASVLRCCHVAVDAALETRAPVVVQCSTGGQGWLDGKR